MTSFPKIAHQRHFVSNAETVDKTTNKYFYNPRAAYVAEDKAEFFLVKHYFPTKFNIPAFTVTHKNMKKFASEILKHTRSRKSDAEEAPNTEGCMKPNIKYK